MLRFLAVMLLATALVLPCSAAARSTPGHHAGRSRAASSTTHGPAGREGAELHTQITRALSIAERYWGATPCGGQILATAGLAVPPGMANGTDAWVTFGSSLGANDLTAPADSYTACRIGLAHWQWPTAATIRTDWGMFCLTVTHEVGHLLGHPHSLAPHSVMAPVFTDESSVPAICRLSVVRSRG